MSANCGPQSSPALEATWCDRVARRKASGLDVRAFCREWLSEPSFASARRVRTFPQIGQRSARATEQARWPSLVLGRI